MFEKYKFVQIGTWRVSVKSDQFEPVVTEYRGILITQTSINNFTFQYLGIGYAYLDLNTCISKIDDLLYVPPSPSPPLPPPPTPSPSPPLPPPPTPEIYYQCSFNGKEGYGEGSFYDYNYPQEKGHWMAYDHRNGGHSQFIRDPNWARLCLQSIWTTGSMGDQAANLATLMSYEPELYKKWVENKGGWFNFDVFIPDNFKVTGWRLFWQMGPSPETRTTGGPHISLMPLNDRTMKIFVRNWATSDGKDKTYLVQYPLQYGWNHINIKVIIGTWKTKDGEFHLWLNRSNVFSNYNIETGQENGTKYINYGIANYGGQEKEPDYGKGQYLLFKDFSVSNERL